MYHHVEPKCQSLVRSKLRPWEEVNRVHWSFLGASSESSFKVGWRMVLVALFQIKVDIPPPDGGLIDQQVD